MTSRTIVFRADASPSIGGGHVMRCLALADALSRQSATCHFACSTQTRASVPALDRSSHRLIDLHDNAALDPLIERFADGCDWLVFDHYGYDASLEAGYRRWARKIMVIDDLANRPHDCDLLLDQTFGRVASDYRELVSVGADVLAGTQYALLRPEFARRRSASLEPRKSARLRRVLVSMGLTDPLNATQIVLEGISQARLPLQVDAVLGPSAPKLAEIHSFVEQHEAMTLHVGGDAMDQLMSQADFCFGAAGTSAWERCCLGLPSALLAVADNQAEIAGRLVDAGAALSLGPISQFAPAKVTDMLLRIERAPESLARIACEAAKICDGRGAERVAMRLVPEKTKGGQSIWLRPAIATDLDLTYEWQCQPETRRFGRNKAIPSRSEHEAWFAARLQNPASLLNVIMCDAEAVGTLRLDQLNSSSYEVSIVVSASFYGRGIGLAALELARRLVPESQIRAEILPGNAHSEALFTKAGYLPTGYGWRSIDALRQNVQ